MKQTLIVFFFIFIMTKIYKIVMILVLEIRQSCPLWNFVIGHSVMGLLDVGEKMHRQSFIIALKLREMVNKFRNICFSQLISKHPYLKCIL